METKILTDTVMNRFIILLSGIAISFGIHESRYFNSQGYLVSLVSYHNWLMEWIMIIVMGLFIGIFTYFIKGFIMFLVLKICGGDVSYKLSRRILLYSGLPIYIVAIFIENINMLLYDIYFTNIKLSITLEYLWLTLMICSFVLFLYLLFYLSRKRSNTGLIRSLIFLIIIPFIFNVLYISKVLYLEEWTKVYKVIPRFF